MDLFAHDFRMQFSQFDCSAATYALIAQFDALKRDAKMLKFTHKNVQFLNKQMNGCAKMIIFPMYILSIAWHLSHLSNLEFFFTYQNQCKKKENTNSRTQDKNPMNGYDCACINPKIK